jgi:cytokinin dehydrogenase
VKARQAEPLLPRRQRSPVDMERRRFLASALAGTVIAGFNPITRSWVRAGAAVPAAMEPIPSLDGVLLMDDDTLETDSTDEGNIVSRRPWAVLRPGSVEDIQRMVLFCGRNGLQVAPRGQAHTVFGQSLVEAGLVIETSTLATIHSIESDRADVDAGVLWKELVTQTVAQGATPPILTGYTALTIGGTLAVGGVGTSGGRQGVQVDRVRELEVITGAGDIVRCSESVRTDLFEGVLAGLGQLGIVTRAVLDLELAPARVQQWTLLYTDPATFFHDLRLVLERDEIEHVYGQMAMPALALIADPSPLVMPLARLFPLIQALTSPLLQGLGSIVTLPALPLATPWVYMLNLAKYHEEGERPDSRHLLRDLSDLRLLRQSQDRPFLDYVLRVDVLIDLLKATGLWIGTPRPWIDVSLPGQVTEQFVTNTFSSLKFDDIGLAGFGLLFPLRRSLLTRPSFTIPESDNEWIYLFDVLTSAPLPGPNTAFVAEKLARNRAIYERARDVGGKLYPISAVTMEPSDWQQQYGTRYPEIAALKQQYDPAGILTPGLQIF